MQCVCWRAENSAIKSLWIIIIIIIIITRTTTTNREAQQHNQHGSRITNYMLIFLNLRTTSASKIFVLNFNSRIQLIPVEESVKLNRRLKSSWQRLSRDNPSRRHGACGWWVNPRDSRSCVCVLFGRVVVGYRHDVATDGLDFVTSLEIYTLPVGIISVTSYTSLYE